MSKMIYIYVDDLRNCPVSIQEREDVVVITVRDYRSAIEVLNTCRAMRWTQVYLDLDHDLGEGKTGYDICKYVIENKIPLFYHIHSSNPVGVMNMNQLLSHYGYETF